MDFAVTPAELAYALSLGAAAIGIGGGMFLYLPLDPKHNGLPPVFFCPEAFSFVGAGAVIVGTTLINALFAMSPAWLLQNVSRLWPVLPVAAVGILVGLLANRHKQRSAR